jgi:hypothetical protein
MRQGYAADSTSCSPNGLLASTVRMWLVGVVLLDFGAMSVGPRIVFTRFPSPDSAKLVPWRDHHRRVVGVDPQQDDQAAAVIAWTLISANNRQLGRAGRLFGRFDEAVTGAQRVTLLDDLEVRLVSVRRLGGFGWFLATADIAELTCARWYETERDRRQAIAAVVAALRVATLQPGARLLRADAQPSAAERDGLD